MAEEQNPAYTKDLVSKLAEAATLVAKPVATAAGEVKPIQRFGRYTFSNPQDAANFVQSDSFTRFWDKEKVGKQNMGIRSEINDARRFNSPKPSETYTQARNRAIATNDRLVKFSEAARAKGQVAPDPKLLLDKFNYDMTKERSVGRFYTNLLGDENLTDDIAHYLNARNSGSANGEATVRVIADKRYKNYNLAGRKPYDGLIDTSAGSHEQRLLARRNLPTSRRVGVDLGAALSSAPRNESFVSSQLANSARRAGRVSIPDGTITLYGMPKTPINTQIKANILPFMGQSMAKASPYLGLVGTGIMAYNGYKDYNSDNMMTREYGATDQFGLRPHYDFLINSVSGQQSIADAWETQRRLVADPEWQLRNPLAATLYNTAHGNFEPLKAFAGGYVPEFLK
jgi:hypothetical protein